MSGTKVMLVSAIRGKDMVVVGAFAVFLITTALCAHLDVFLAILH